LAEKILSTAAQTKTDRKKRHQDLMKIVVDDTLKEKIWDAIVIGGGPSGCACAAMLAQKGWNVLILEKDHFPRYHIGESLIPYCWFPLQRIGILDKIKAANFTPKNSVQFVNAQGIASKPFCFSDHMQHDCTQTWQVSRNDFDKLLLDHAQQCGAIVQQGTIVDGLISKDGVVKGVKAKKTQTGESSHYHAKITIDASGRSMVSAAGLGWRKQDPSLKKIAIWSYFKGAQRNDGIDAGATTIASLPKQGWFWFIPLSNDIVSIGVVAERNYLFDGAKDIEEIYLRELSRQPWISSRTQSSERISACHITNDYSYRSEYCGADGLILTGDAFAFLDPMFSSGVFLALQSAVMAADAVDAALTKDEISSSQFHAYGHELCKGIENMRKLIYAFYTEAFSFAELLRKHPEVQGDLTDCLIGNLWKNFDSLFAAIHEQCELPESLLHGRTPFNTVKR
jgi:flavin-dependent dehydrogenase